MTTPSVLWRPTESEVERSHIQRYRGWLATERALQFSSYDDLWRWSVESTEEFWVSVWDFFEVQATHPYAAPLTSREMPDTEWFSGAQLNYAEHIFRDRTEDDVAILYASELRPLAEWTWGELTEQTARIAAGLRELGVEPGDRVAGYLPNIPEAVAAFLACASIGAVWSSASPDFGTKAVSDRFAQIEPKVLLAVDGYRYGGRDFDRRPVVDELRGEISSIEQTVLLGYLDQTATLDGTVAWDDFLGRPAPLTFSQVPFDHPLWILYSSGTTGLPKGIVHGHGGILLEQLKQQHFHLDARSGDRILWFTTTGWMMWNYLVGCLLTGAAIILYEGNPGHPDMGTLWDLAEASHATCFGTSASYIAGCQKAGIQPAEGRDLSALRAVGSTGSPLSSDGFDWIYEQLGARTWLFSTSGGSDLCTAFVTGCPVLPVYRGELQCLALGASVEAWDEAGHSLVGEVGELVLTRPMPCMPLRLWNDPDGERLRDSYFSVYPGTWRHGDWIEITDRRSAVIHGRSDSTINRGGIRMGTSEIYAAVLSIDEVLDAIVVDVQTPGEESWMPLFITLSPGAELTDDLRGRLGRRIRDDCSPRHVPNDVFAVPAIPRTLSGKPLEVPIKRILMGADPEQAASRDSLADPEALDWFIDLARQRNERRSA